MKTWLVLNPQRRLNRSEAWGCFTANLALPASRSLVAGRAIGHIQITCAFIGMGITLVVGMRFIMWFFANWARLSDQSQDPFGYLQELWTAAQWPLGGMAIFTPRNGLIIFSGRFYGFYLSMNNLGYFSNPRLFIATSFGTPQILCATLGCIARIFIQVETETLNPISRKLFYALEVSMYNNRPGCLGGLLRLALLRWVFDGLQKLFGFRSKSCFGCGCGLILLVLFVMIALSIIFNTDWSRLVLAPWLSIV